MLWFSRELFKCNATLFSLTLSLCFRSLCCISLQFCLVSFATEVSMQVYDPTVFKVLRSYIWMLSVIWSNLPMIGGDTCDWHVMQLVSGTTAYLLQSSVWHSYGPADTVVSCLTALGLLSEWSFALTFRYMTDEGDFSESWDTVQWKRQTLSIFSHVQLLR